MGGPIRILHVVVNMNRGGAETLIMNLYRNIDRKKVQFDFLTSREGVFDKEIVQLGGTVYRIPYISDVGHFQYIKALNTFFFKNAHYQIVHSHMDKMSGLVLRAAKKAGIPVRISHSHNTSSEGGSMIRLYKWYAGQFIIPNATNLFACSSEAAKWLFNKKYTLTKIFKNGIESNKFLFSSEIRREVRKELEINDESFVLGHVGRFNRQKNHSFLVDTFYQYNKINQNSVLLLAGDGALRSTIEKKVSALGLMNKVKFIGNRSDIHRVLQAMDVFVFPSLHEGLPVSLIEAQASGLPCIISDTISSEVDLHMDLIYYSSLLDKKSWVENLNDIAATPSSRRIMLNSISIQGYDVQEAADEIEKFYLKVSG